MNSTQEFTANNKEARSVPSRLYSGSLWLVFGLWLVFIAGCTSVGTVVHEVQMENAKKHGPGLGKTLIVVFTPTKEVVITLENEWVRRLRERSIDADAANKLLPDQIPPEKQQIVDLVNARGFNTVLVCRIISVKQIERNVDSYQVATVETTLYETRTEEKFWSAYADTFLVNPTGERIIQQRSERVREFVDTLISEMAKSNLI